MKYAQNNQNSYRGHKGQWKYFDFAVKIMEPSLRMAFTIRVHFLNFPLALECNVVDFYRMLCPNLDLRKLRYEELKWPLVKDMSLKSCLCLSFQSHKILKWQNVKFGQIACYSWVNFTLHMFDLAWSIHRKYRPNKMRHTLTPLSNHCKFQGVPHATQRLADVNCKRPEVKP